jgi:AcrB/AcrD/AcrF family/YtkA-like
VEGALLRLRPKVMTVSTVIAGLLPIMWSTRVGAEVMKPLATPVLGGMVSSLLHVLIVTPVIFFWIRERRLGLHQEPLSDTEAIGWRPAIVAVVVVVLLAVGGIGMWQVRRGAGVGARAPLTTGSVVRRVQSGDLEIALLSPTGSLHTGRNAFTFEFQRGGQLIDVGTVRATGNMPMPGMVMSSGMEVAPSGVTGRYNGSAEFGMAGAWQMSVEWDGPMGKGSASFEGPVQ